MRIKNLALAAGAVIALGAAIQSVAHHSFAAEFDVNRPIILRGVVSRMEFSNPHSWLHITVTTDAGEVQEWKVEGGAPNALIRRGWNRNSIESGTPVCVEGYQARDRSFRASGRSVRLPNGSELFMGSTGIGAAPVTEDAGTGNPCAT
ncbi:MAG: DUF6152 family protein [Gammaproteobacteria bacterium]|nr:DUF6152 family protein [Gammaproteobacteria bacterium]